MRIDTLDVLRGIAIIGIVFMNIYHLGTFELGYTPFENPPMWDHIIQVFNQYFIDSRFRSILCLLFGAGLVIQWQKSQADSLDGFIKMKSRLKWLLLFGLLHGALLFAGDILLTYAIAGLFVYRHIDKPSDALMEMAIKYMVIGAVVLMLIGLIPSDPVYRYSDEHREMYQLWHQNFVYQLQVQGIFVAAMILLSPLCLMWFFGGMMLLGAALYKMQFFKTGLSRRYFYRILCVAMAVSSFDVYLQLSHFARFAELSFALASISGLFMALIYCHLIITLGERFRVVLTPFKQAGKVAFSLYILQSLILGGLLRVFMPEFNFEATRSDYVMIALGYSAFQLGLAVWYLQKFKQGPLESLWRKCYQRSIKKALAINTPPQKS